MQQATNPTPEKFLKACEVTSQTGFGKSFIYNEIKAGRFPAPVKIGPRASRWKLSAVNAWMAAQG